MRHAFGVVVVAAVALVGGAPGIRAFDLSSPDVPANGTVPMKHVYNGYGCTGENISPELVWKEAPEGARSFAVTVFDPDAPTETGWWHWLVFDIPVAVTRLAANAGNPTTHLAPPGSIQSLTDFGTVGYGGPCPPVGSKPHRYVFTVYALKLDKLPLDAMAKPSMVSYYLKLDALAKASFTATFRR